VLVGHHEPEAHVATEDEDHREQAGAEQGDRDHAEDPEDREDRVPLALGRQHQPDEGAGDEDRDGECRERAADHVTVRQQGNLDLAGDPGLGGPMGRRSGRWHRSALADG
jgi:hypothetical protein